MRRVLHNAKERELKIIIPKGSKLQTVINGNLSLHGQERKHFDKVRSCFCTLAKKCATAFGSGRTEETGKIHKTREAAKGDILPRVACIMHEGVPGRPLRPALPPPHHVLSLLDASLLI